MLIQTSVKDEENIGLLCNTLSAEAGRFLYSDKRLYDIIMRAQAAIESLEQLLEESNEFAEELKREMI